MASLQDLVHALLPTARRLGPGGSGLDGDRDVTWVRVMRARVPAFEALDSGDLAIIPGPALALVAPGPGQIEELAAALARTRVPAVVLVEGEGGGASLSALGAAAVAVGLTVLALDRADPIALERSVIGFLVNRRAEIDRRAAELEAQLAGLALRGAGLDAQAATIGAFLGRAVVLEGRRGDAIAIHAPTDVPGAGAAVAAYLATPTGSAALRVPIAGPAGDPVAGGRLVLLGDEPANEMERVAAERIAALLALELAREEAVRQAREETRRGDPLPVDGPPWVVLVASQAVPGPSGTLAAFGGPDAPTSRDAAIDPIRQPPDPRADLARREAVRAELRALLSPRRVVLRGSAESLELRLVAAAPEDDPAGLATARRLAEFLGRSVAVSRSFADPGGRPAAEAMARATLEVAARLQSPPLVLRAERLPVYLLLGNVRNLPDGERQARELLAPILGGRPEARRDRLETLLAVLGTPSLGEAASRLGVHRNTVAYRVAGLEARTGWDLTDPDLRFALELAGRIVRNAQL